MSAPGSHNAEAQERVIPPAAHISPPSVHASTFCRVEEGQLYYTMEFSVEGQRQKADGTSQGPSFSRHNVSVYAVRSGSQADRRLLPTYTIVEQPALESLIIVELAAWHLAGHMWVPWQLQQGIVQSALGGVLTRFTCCRDQQLYTLNAQTPADKWQELSSSMQRAAESFHVF